MSNDVSEVGSQFSHQALRGIVIIAVAYAGANSIAPFAETLPQQTLSSLLFIVVIASTYGLILIGTSPLCLEVAEYLEDRVAAFRNSEQRE